MKKYITIITIIQLTITAISAQKADVLLPTSLDREIVIHHNGFSLSYNTNFVLSSWVSYKVIKSQINPTEEFKGKYITDPSITTRSASKKDYKDNGYLMAQLVNYLDISQITGATDESFYMSNIVPMKLAFYNYIWIKSEELIRLWTTDTDGLYVIAGPILNDGPFATIGENNVSMPKRYFKAIYDPKNQKAIAFIFKNGSTSGSLKSYAMSVDKLETETGIDFFPGLDDELENKIESGFVVSNWNFDLIED